MYYLWLKQNGGCDYTIGCGETPVPMKAATLEQAEKEAVGLIVKYGSDNIWAAKIMEFCKDGGHLVKQANEIFKEKRKDRIRQRKLAEMEKLKKELEDLSRED